MSNQFAPGVTVSGGLCATTLLGGWFGGDPVQIINYNWQNPAGGYTCNGFYGQAITFTFAQAIDSLGFLAITDGGDITFSTLSGVSSQSTSGLNRRYYGFADATPFTTVQVSVGGDGLIALDDLSYSAAVVATPEPASIALVATGLLGMFGVVRRRKAFKRRAIARLHAILPVVATAEVVW